MNTPLTAFLSYRRNDAADLRLLERALRLRGVRTWRDVNDVPLGGATEEEIVRAIATETDAFVLYASPRLYEADSTFIWQKELPVADARWRASRYPVVVLYRGTTPDQLSTRCTNLGLSDFGRVTNGEWVPLRGERADDPEARRRALREVAGRVLGTLLGRAAVSAAGVTLRSFPVESVSDALLDLDWSGVVDGAEPALWDEELLPALHDFARRLEHAGVRELTLYPQARLALCVAFGFALPLASRVRMRLMGREGEWVQRPGPPPLALSSETTDGDPEQALVVLGLSRDISASGQIARAELRPAHIRVATPPSALDGLARPLAQQVGDELRALAGRGVRHFHLLLAGPAPMAVAIGRQLHALGEVSLYYADGERRPALAFRIRT